ncbi:MAG: PAS domain S-box protein [Sandaracinaceae bacterium]
MPVDSNTLRVLLVEDNEGDVELIRRALRDISAEAATGPSTELSTISDGRACLRFLASDAAPPDVILLDLKMPGMNGHEVLAELSAHPEWSLITKVVLTSSSAPEDVTSAYRLHAAACFKKPPGGYGPLLKRILDFVSAASRPSLRMAGSNPLLPRANADDPLRRAFEVAPAPLLLLDEAGHVERANADARRLFGWAREELVGQPLERLVVIPSDVDLDRTRAEAVQVEGLEMTGRHRDATEFPIELSLLPVGSGPRARTLCSITDMTDRRLAEARFRLAVEAAPCGILMVDGDGTVLLVNKELERLFRYGRGELLGKSIEQLVPAASRSGHAGLRQSFVAQPSRRGMGSGRDLHGLRKDGTEFPVEIGLNPIRTAEGVLVFSTVVDITKRRALMEERERHRRELERSNEELEQFAYAASHDLQEPLRMVSAFTTLLAEHLGDALDEDGKRYIHFAQDGAERMRTLINGLLALSRIRTQSAERVPVDVTDCIREALLDLTPLISETGADIQVDVGTGTWVSGDAAQLRSLFANLLSNALKYRRQAAPAVQISAAPDGPLLRVSVRDNGIGVPPDQFTRIFMLFERLHTREEHSGTGIGLALVKRVVERHGGTVEVESDGSSGSTFHFTLERADVDSAT